MELDFENQNFLYLAFAGETRPILESIDAINNLYGAEFKLVDEVEVDGVEFAIVEIGKSSVKSIFHLGFLCAQKLEKLRENKITHWRV
ncbi:MAG: hypothetical protein IPN76_16235 [Saprospiraceae bacterium]|nr:hypothetical protein [Saprospiraceae bacterium]